MKKVIYVSFFTCLCVINLKPSNSSAQIISTIAGNGTIATGFGCCGDGGAATAAEFSDATSIVEDGSGNLLITDWTGSRIRKVDPSGIITAYTGSMGYSGDGGMVGAANVNLPTYIMKDGAGNIYFSDQGNQVVRKINTSGIISTIAGTTTFSTPMGDGGPATDAQLRNPMGLAIDGSGNLYIGSYSSSRVRKVNAAGIITTVAGNGIYGYSGDGGQATAAKLSDAAAIAVDAAGDLYIADEYNHAIRKVNAAGIITTIAGNGTAGFSGDGGPATAAMLKFPTDIKFDAAGNLFIADRDNNRVRKISPSGIITTVAGNGTAGHSGDGGSPTAAKMWAPYGLAFDHTGNLLIAEDSGAVVRKVTPGSTTMVNGNYVASASNMSIIPNPNTGVFTVQGMLNTQDNEPVSFKITNVIGETVYQNSITTQNGRVNALISPDRNLLDGLYFLHMTSPGINEVVRFVVRK